MNAKWNSKSIFLVLLAAILLALPVGTAAAQSDELRLTVNKVFGYNWQADIRGTFRLGASGPADLASVTFLIDGEPVGTVDQAPFSLEFKTTDYPVGEHLLSATGTTAAGQQLTSAERTFNFISNEGQAAAFPAVIGPLFLILGGLAVAIFVIQWLAFRPGRRKVIPLGAPRSYGMTGGAICPHCKRPYAIHWWGMNMVGGKLDRCEHCGRWGMMRRASREALARAEAAELEMAGPAVPVAEKTPEERLREQLDRSKYLE